MARHGHRVDGLKVAQARQNILVRGKPITQAGFAERLGIHWVTMNRIENDKALVSLELIEKIASVTGVTREELLLSDEDEEAAPPMTASQENLLEVLYEQLGKALGKSEVAA